MVYLSIKEGDFIRLSYTGEYNGTVFDTTNSETAKEWGIYNPQSSYGPITVRVGGSHVVKGIDLELAGKDAGYEGEIIVPPELGFGNYDESKLESFPKKVFKENPKPGMQVRIENKGSGVIVRVIGGRAIVDFNNSLAGKTLNYKIKIEDLVESPEEKVKGIIELFTGHSLDVSLTEGKLQIELPAGIGYDQAWLIWRGRIIHEIWQFLSEVQEITFVETIRREEKNKEEVSD